MIARSPHKLGDLLHLVPKIETSERRGSQTSADIAASPSSADVAIVYQVGLLCLALGALSTALEHFEIIEGVRPGFRDVARRVAELRRFRDYLSQRLQLVESP